jgi:hypothetical protein
MVKWEVGVVLQGTTTRGWSITTSMIPLVERRERSSAGANCSPSSLQRQKQIPPCAEMVEYVMTLSFPIAHTVAPSPTFTDVLGKRFRCKLLMHVMCQGRRGEQGADSDLRNVMRMGFQGVDGATGRLGPAGPTKRHSIPLTVSLTGPETGAPAPALAPLPLSSQIMPVGQMLQSCQWCSSCLPSWCRAQRGA